MSASTPAIIRAYSARSAYVDFVREGTHGNGAARTGEARWRRLTEVRFQGNTVHFTIRVVGCGARGRSW